MRRALVTPIVFVFLACAKLADLETSGSGTAPASSSDAGSLPPSPEGIRASLRKLEKPTPCGATTEFQYLTLESQSDRAVTYEVKVPEGSAFDLRAEDGTVGRSVKGTIAPKAVVTVYIRVTSSSPGALAGDLFVTTGETLQKLETTATVAGGKLTITPPLIGFGDVRQQTDSNPEIITLTNTGTETVTLNGWLPAETTDFAFTPPNLAIEPGETKTVSAKLKAGAAGAPISTAFSPSTGGALCEAALPVTLNATRVNQDVTVNPATAGFGNVDCNSTPGPKTITVSNYSTSATATYTVTLPASSWFTTSAITGTVPTGTAGGPGKATFDIGLLPTADFRGHSEPITVAITSPDSGTRTVTASVQIRGAFVDFSATALAFDAPGQTRSFNIRNLGNERIALAHSSSTGVFDPDDRTVLEEAGNFFGLDRGTVSVKFTAGGGTHAADIRTVRTTSTFGSGKLCNDPAPIVKATAAL